MIPDVVEILQQLIRIPSVNPMGRDVPDDPHYCEQALSVYLEQFFRDLGVGVWRQNVEPRRTNILAWTTAPADDRQRPIVMFEAHQDTVPVDGMTIDPWQPRIEQGRVYGRGACDVKGAMACMLTAFARLACEPSAAQPMLVMACTVNEEHGFSGARRLVQSWADGTAPMLPRPPDQVIVAEPTNLQVMVTHKGVLRWRCHTLGRAAHSACPDKGENAIYHMGHVVLQLQRCAESLIQRGGDPRVGPPTLNVGTIHGGICVNAVPDRCTIEIDRRLGPDEEPEAALQHVLDWLTQHAPPAERIQHDPPFLVSRGLSDRGNMELAARLQQILHRQGFAAQQIGGPYGTNAPFYASVGVPTVVFGPGSIEQAHTAAEWIAIDQLHTAVDVYTAVGQGATITR
ncbi:MAG: M20 family metallopeptidase [Planctomycetaceae bacterium]|nr:M20 family metallopeptidase [Planctomycetaceae bacterium]